MIPLALGYSESRSKSVNDGQCINVFPCINPADAKSTYTLTERPGLLRKVRPTGADGEVRAMIRHMKKLYSLVGNEFYVTDLVTLASTKIGNIVSRTGKAWMEKNSNSQIMIAAGDEGYVYNWGTGAFGKIADSDFPGSASLTFQDQFGVSVDPNSARLRNSDLNDFTAWGGTDFVSAEGAPDNLLSIISDHQEIIGLGEDTVEIYSNVGGVDLVFARQEGGFIEVGVNAPGSIAKITNVVCWLDDALQVRMLEAYNPSIISTPSLSYHISRLERTDDALGMTHVWNGHAFYILTFPTAKRTFVYDITESVKAGAKLWHELRSYPLERLSRWRGNSILRAGQTTFVGDYENGWIYTFDEDTHTDNLQPMSRVWTTASVFDIKQRRNIFHQELELEVEAGVGTDSEEDPQVAMQYSDDGGKTWSNELWESIGKIGDYQNRARWQALGDSRNRIYRFTMTDDSRLEVVGVYLRSEMGYH